MQTAPGETLEGKRAAVRPGAIILARHGKPDCDRRARVDWRGYIDWWENYNASGLLPNQAKRRERLIEVAGAADLIFSSTTRRAVETAEVVANGRPIIQDPVFAEAPLPPPRWWGRHRARWWGVLARISWWLGNSHGEESRKEAEQRAEAAVATLTARALRGETVFLAAHGWFNRMMRRVLKRQGWVEVENHGDRYWAYRRFEKRR